MDIFDVNFSDLDDALNLVFSNSLFGVILGAAIAAYASWFTTTRQHKRETDEKIAALLSSLYHELMVVWRLYLEGIGSQLIKLEDGKPFTCYAPMYENYYLVYETNAQNIGLIPDGNLRDKIISTYTLAKALKDSFLLNNKLDDERVENQKKKVAYKERLDFERSVVAYGTVQHPTPATSEHMIAESIHADSLKKQTDYAAVLKDAHQKTHLAVNDVLKHFERYFAEHPVL